MPVVRGITNPEIVQPPEYPPSDETLRGKALAYLKENKRTAFRRMSKNNELEEYLQSKVKMCRSTADYLMQAGVWENEA